MYLCRLTIHLIPSTSLAWCGRLYTPNILAARAVIGSASVNHHARTHTLSHKHVRCHRWLLVSCLRSRVFFPRLLLKWHFSSFSGEAKVSSAKWAHEDEHRYWVCLKLPWPCIPSLSVHLTRKHKIPRPIRWSAFSKSCLKFPRVKAHLIPFHVSLCS